MKKRTKMSKGEEKESDAALDVDLVRSFILLIALLHSSFSVLMFLSQSSSFFLSLLVLKNGLFESPTSSSHLGHKRTHARTGYLVRANGIGKEVCTAQKNFDDVQIAKCKTQFADQKPTNADRDHASMKLWGFALSSVTTSRWCQEPQKSVIPSLLSSWPVSLIRNIP